jgi:hypothetical protein
MTDLPLLDPGSSAEHPSRVLLAQRVAFQSAYRDLVQALNPITHESFFFSFTPYGSRKFEVQSKIALNSEHE